MTREDVIDMFQQAAAAEQMQEPVRRYRELDRLYEAGLLSAGTRYPMRRYGAGSRWFFDWEHSCFNPAFRSTLGKNDADIDKLTTADRYIRVNHAINPAWQYFVRKVLIEDYSIDEFLSMFPIFNRTGEEKAVLLRTLNAALDQIAEAYECLDRKKTDRI